MHAVLTNLGVTGDVQPFLTLALELARHGQRPVLALAPEWKQRVESLDLEFMAIGPPEQADMRTVMARTLDTPNAVAQAKRFLDLTMPMMPQIFKDLREICRSADVVIAGPTQPAAQMVHHATGIPFVSLKYNHFGVPSVHRPPPPGRLPMSWLPAPLLHRLNRARWARERRLLRELSAPLISPHRVALGLEPLDEPLQMDSNSDQLALFAVSRHVACPPPDWPPRYHLTGFFFPDHDGWKPDPALSEFLEAGEPPVVITFGSMVHRDSRAMTELLLEAVERAGCRALLQSGWSGLKRERLPSHVHAIDYVPYGWLLPRVACVVQHGGAGTMAETLRAGVPAVFVPHLNVDQPLWADLARSLGCARHSIPYHRLTAKALGSAISATLVDGRLKRAAAQLGALIRSERGVQTARERIEELLR